MLRAHQLTLKFSVSPAHFAAPAAIARADAFVNKILNPLPA
jgi:hypothetical protein